MSKAVASSEQENYTSENDSKQSEEKFHQLHQIFVMCFYSLQKTLGAKQNEIELLTLVLGRSSKSPTISLCRLLFNKKQQDTAD